MTERSARTFEVRIDDPLGSTRVAHDPVSADSAGEVLLEVEKFGLTANNVTYAVLGNDTPTRYWDVFPAGEGWGRVPAWGSARVVGGDGRVAHRGERFVGLMPMADRFVMPGRRTDAGAIRSTTAQRASMPSTYRDLQSIDDEQWRSAESGANHLLQPLYSFAALLASDVADGLAEAVVVSSASSKAGLLVGRLLSSRGLRVVGLTSPASVEDTRSTGAFSEVLEYADLLELGTGRPTTFLDIAGNPRVAAGVIQRLGGSLTRNIVIGATHHASAHDSAGDEGGPAREFFDTASRETELARVDGDVGLRALEREARETLLPWARSWLRIREVHGISGVPAAWARVQRPPSSPLTGTVVVAAAPR